MEVIWKDVRFGLRTLWRRPGFAAVVMVTLALGIGANSAIFSVINGVVLRPLPYEKPEQLVAVWNRLDAHGLPRLWFSEPEFLDYRQSNTVFQNFAVFVSDGANLTGGDRPARVAVGYASGDFFPMLRGKALRGRLLAEEDDQPGLETRAVLGYEFWRDRMGGDDSVLGRKLNLDGETATVIGILQPGFRFQEERIDVWVPMAIDPAKLRSRGSHYLMAFARLKPGVGLDEAQAEMDAIASRLEEQHPDNYGDAGWGTTLYPIQEEVVGEVRPALLLLLAAVGFVLLISCVNVANLMLVRGAARVKEMAIRTALGAGRWRMFRQLLTESGALALLGGGLGLGLAYGSLRALQWADPGNIPRLAEVAIDGGVLLFTLSVSILTGVIFGVVPAFQATRQDPNEALKEGGRDAGSGSRRGFLKVLAVTEVALSLTLLVGAGLMVRGFSKLNQVDPGFRTDGLMTFRTSLPRAKYGDDRKQADFYRRLLERVEALPGVVSAGAVSSLPLSGSYSSGTISAESPSPSATGDPFLEADRRAVTPGYFQTMGIELVEGRFPNLGDTEDSPRVVVVDTELANRFWPGESALGKRLKMGGPQSNDAWREVVGVVGHVRHYGLQELGREQVYTPFEQRPSTSMFTVVRTDGDPAPIAAAVRGELARLDPEVPMFGDATMRALLSENLAAPRFNVLLVALFAALALVLAAVGVFGVLSHSVAQRSHEIGVRMALGAGRGDVMAMVLREALLLGIVGGALGLATALVLTRWLSSFLYGVSPADPATYAAVGLVLAFQVLVAALIPVRRASRVDPMDALRRS